MDAESVLESQNFWHQVITKFGYSIRLSTECVGFEMKSAICELRNYPEFLVTHPTTENRRHKNVIVGSDSGVAS